MEGSCGVQKQFSCDRCCYKGKTKAHLNSHKRVHNEKTLQCSQCYFKARYKHELASHNLIHSGRRSFVCTYKGCTYSSSQANHLATHQLVHSNLKPFKCNLCEKCFRQSSHLNCHIRTHTGEKPYKCLFKDCDYSSTQPGHLQIHFRSHTGEKPYHCSYETCEYSSRQSSHLKQHMMTHKDGKVYTCSFKNCKYSSIHASDFKRHTSRVHVLNKRHVCQLCEYRPENAVKLKRHIKYHQNALQTCISRPRLNSFSSSSMIEIESTKAVSNSNLIKIFEVDKDPKLIVRTFAFVRLTRLKPYNYIYNKYFPVTSVLKLKNSQKTDSRPGDSPSAGVDPKLRVPTIVVLERLQVDYNSDDEHIGDSLRAKADLTIPSVSKCTEIITEPQTGPKSKPWKASLYTCKICDYETKKFKKYKSHLQSHREKREFFCPLCDFVGFKKKLLKSHLLTHDNDSSASDSGRCSNTQSHHARVSITGQKASSQFDNTSVKTNCFGSQSLQNKEIEVQEKTISRKAHSVANGVQLQEIRTKRNQSFLFLNPNRRSQAKMKISSQSPEKKHVLFSCIFCNKIFKKEMKLLNHLRYHTGEPRPSHLHY